MSTRQNVHAAGGSAGADETNESFGTLITGVIKDLQDLMRAEMRLAKTEIKEDAGAMGRAAAMIAAGALLGTVGLIFLMLAATYLLDEWVKDWVAALIVGGALALIAAIIALNGKKKLSAANLKPEATIETIKEDQQWAKQQMSSVKR